MTLLTTTSYWLLLGLLAVVNDNSRTWCEAFVPQQRRAFQKSSTCFTPVVGVDVHPTQTLLVDNILQQKQQQPSFVKLSMGVVDEFVTTNDAKLRSKGNELYLKELQKRVDAINELESTIEELADDELQAKTKEFQQRLAGGEDINGPILEEAFAVVREAAW
jgi:hypothetical protein